MRFCQPSRPWSGPVVSSRRPQHLNVTPSAVSQRIKLLEERIGAVLVVRGQPCLATEVGERLCQHVEQVALLEASLGRAFPVCSMMPGR